jgi:hypothetical protein
VGVSIKFAVPSNVPIKQAARPLDVTRQASCSRQWDNLAADLAPGAALVLAMPPVVKALLIVGILSLMTGVAFAQAPPPGPDQCTGKTEIRRHGAVLTIDRGVGKGQVQIKCADADTTRQCVEATLPVISSGQDTVVFATVSIKCGSTVYTVSTGTKGGGCSVGSAPNGPTDSVNCEDGGNKASANCVGGCGTAGGSGSCTITSAP